MSPELKVGDRVRVSVRNRMHGYQTGERGTVVRQLVAGPSGTCYYLVAMDEDDPAKTGVVFTNDEIELDLDARAAP
jgi:hypothetical protein